VLVVEDNLDTLALFTVILENSRATVSTCIRGDEVLMRLSPGSLTCWSAISDFPEKTAAHVSRHGIKPDTKDLLVLAAPCRPDPSHLNFRLS
jgi:hypothetical protein